MPDGSKRQGTSYETSPMDIAKEISKSLSERIVISKVDETLWDLERPLEADCKLELFDFDTPEGKRVFWHSSAHVLGEACEKHYGCHLCIGPPTEEGFFYEMAMGDSGDRMITQGDFTALETLIKGATKESKSSSVSLSPSSSSSRCSTTTSTSSTLSSPRSQTAPPPPSTVAVP